jgi:hypothetical protein
MNDINVCCLRFSVAEALGDGETLETETPASISGVHNGEHQ